MWIASGVLGIAKCQLAIKRRLRLSAGPRETLGLEDMRRAMPQRHALIIAHDHDAEHSRCLMCDGETAWHLCRTITDLEMENNVLGTVIAAISVVSSGMQQIFCRTMQQKHSLASHELLANTAPAQVCSFTLRAPPTQAQLWAPPHLPQPAPYSACQHMQQKHDPAIHMLPAPCPDTSDLQCCMNACSAA